MQFQEPTTNPNPQKDTQDSTKSFFTLNSLNQQQPGEWKTSSQSNNSSSSFGSFRSSFMQRVNRDARQELLSKSRYAKFYINQRIKFKELLKDLTNMPAGPKKLSEMEEETENFSMDQLTASFKNSNFGQKSGEKKKKRQTKAEYERKRARRWLGYLQSYEWFTSISPEDYDPEEWLVYPLPLGKRCIVVTKNNVTIVSSGKEFYKCQTRLSGGSNSTSSNLCCWLDCVQDAMNPKKFYVLDALMLVGQPLIELSAEMRLFFLRTHLSPELQKIAKNQNEISFNLIEPVSGSFKEVYELTTSRLDFRLNSLLIVDKESEYSVGMTSPDCFQTKLEKSSIQGQKTQKFLGEILMRFNEFNRRFLTEDEQEYVQWSPSDYIEEKGRVYYRKWGRDDEGVKGFLLEDGGVYKVLVREVQGGEILRFDVRCFSRPGGDLSKDGGVGKGKAIGGAELKEYLAQIENPSDFRQFLGQLQALNK